MGLQVTNNSTGAVVLQRSIEKIKTGEIQFCPSTLLSMVHVTCNTDKIKGHAMYGRQWQTDHVSYVHFQSISTIYYNTHLLPQKQG